MQQWFICQSDGSVSFWGYIYGTCKYYVVLWFRDIVTVLWRHEWNRYKPQGHYTVVVWKPRGPVRLASEVLSISY